jgi:hypothetical protein
MRNPLIRMKPPILVLSRILAPLTITVAYKATVWQEMLPDMGKALVFAVLYFFPSIDWLDMFRALKTTMLVNSESCTAGTTPHRAPLFFLILKLVVGQGHFRRQSALFLLSIVPLLDRALMPSRNLLEDCACEFKNSVGAKLCPGYDYEVP